MVIAPHAQTRSTQLSRRRTKVIGFAAFASWLCFHVLLGLAMVRYPVLAKTQAITAFAVGLFFALLAKRSDTVAVVSAYLVASEGLWRMSGGIVFWEFGKYSIAAILFVWAARRRAFDRSSAPLAYFLLLLPSALITCLNRDASSARNILSSDLSGPLCLTSALLFFGNAALSWRQISKILQVALGPVVGMAVVCSFATVRMTAEDFGAESNFEASGGFGPNQVSAMLGWGMVLAFLWFITAVRRKWSLPLAGALILLFAAQAALTFSRTGVYLGVGGIALGIVCLARNPRQALSVVAATGGLAAVGWIIIFPFLDSFTGGKLSERFAEKGFTGREDIAWADIKVFAHHPLLGTGVGLSRQARISEFGVGHMAHTEYTRLLSEHGVLGFSALVIVVLAALQRLVAARSALERAFVAAMLSSAFLFMACTAMRLALPAFALGFATVRLVPSQVVGSRRIATFGRSWISSGRPLTSNGSRSLQSRSRSLQEQGSSVLI
jgi:hypothetical protein